MPFKRFKKFIRGFGKSAESKQFLLKLDREGKVNSKIRKSLDNLSDKDLESILPHLMKKLDYTNTNAIRYVLSFIAALPEKKRTKFEAQIRSMPYEHWRYYSIEKGTRVKESNNYPTETTIDLKNVYVGITFEGEVTPQIHEKMKLLTEEQYFDILTSLKKRSRELAIKFANSMAKIDFARNKTAKPKK
ncbi:MAG: hypothetical protein CL944_01700 [Candidatus Diapherotrites archaeon]|uniref:Uncharacterized protein n=1 Tax=Candidatus Iainarchaeum sp. TaxID=3101447 RepID=A0A2D6LPQ4_9ARCH|nr:hypothetical protein [Candidatus Diapherotrites archaeon]|tara:strand:- start:3584 stop:4150 length:567 start_codon:yes stop_codon:yes gene_type:complete